MRSLRRARGWTQDELAKRGKLSVDTIRRIEHGSFSPSLETLRRLCAGLGLGLPTFFAALELGDAPDDLALVDALRAMSPRARLIALRLCSTLLEIDAAGL